MPETHNSLWSRFRGLQKHHQAAIIIGVIVVIAAIAIGTVHLVPTPDDGIDTAGPRTMPALDVRLAIEQRFAPVLKLDSKELLLPISIPTYVSTTTLDERIGKVLKVVQKAPAPASLPTSDVECFPAAGCMFQLDVRGVEPPRSKPPAYGAINKGLLAHGAKVTVYANVLQYHNTGDYSVQYWFLYLFNYRLNEHESDWEQITIVLDKDQNPKSVLYSSHATGFTRPWSEVEHDGDHPIVYVARGSHANYFHAGSHPVTVLCPKFFKRFGVCVEKRDIRDKSDGLGKTLLPGVSYEVTEMPAPVYIGSYGTGNYVSIHRANDLLSDPRRRPAWTEPARTAREGNAAQGEPMSVDDSLRLEYDQTLQLVRTLTDVRFKLLAFVPTIAGFGVGLFGKPRPAVELLAVGLIGLVATLGIFIYELRNSQTYAAAVRRAAELERTLGMPSGPGRSPARAPRPNRAALRPARRHAASHSSTAPPSRAGRTSSPGARSARSKSPTHETAASRSRS